VKFPPIDTSDIPELPDNLADRYTVEELQDVIFRAIDKGTTESDRSAKWAAKLLEQKGKLADGVKEHFTEETPIETIIEETHTLLSKTALQNVLRKANVQITIMSGNKAAKKRR